MLTLVLKVIGVSFERPDFSQENQDEKLEELLKFGKILTGRDFNQKYELLSKSLRDQVMLLWNLIFRYYIASLLYFHQLFMY